MILLFMSLRLKRVNACAHVSLICRATCRAAPTGCHIFFLCFCTAVLLRLRELHLNFVFLLTYCNEYDRRNMLTGYFLVALVVLSALR